MKPLLDTPETGLLIAVDGNDGCGKSTQITMLLEWLAEEYPDRSVAYVKCPAMGGGPGILRRLSLGEPVVGVDAAHQMVDGMPIFNPDKQQEAMSDGLTQRWILFAEWLWTYQQTVLPLLRQDIIVVLDRSHFLSNYVYGIGQGIPAHLVERVVAEQFAHTRHPDLALILDLPVDVAKQRIAGRPDSTEKGANHFDLASEETFLLRRQCYRELTDRWDWAVLVDASGTPEEVSARLCATVAAELHERQHATTLANASGIAVREALRLTARGFVGAVNTPETWDDLRARVNAAFEQAERELGVTHMVGDILLGPSDTPCLAVASARGTHLYFPEGVDLIDLFALTAALQQEQSNVPDGQSSH